MGLHLEEYNPVLKIRLVLLTHDLVLSFSPSDPSCFSSYYLSICLPPLSLSLCFIRTSFPNYLSSPYFPSRSLLLSFFQNSFSSFHSLPRLSLLTQFSSHHAGSSLYFTPFVAFSLQSLSSVRLVVSCILVLCPSWFFPLIFYPSNPSLFSSQSLYFSLSDVSPYFLSTLSLISPFPSYFSP